MDWGFCHYSIASQNWVAERNAIKTGNLSFPSNISVPHCVFLCLCINPWLRMWSFFISHTHLAEKRLSTDLCEWSEVTVGLLWEAERERESSSNRLASSAWSSKIVTEGWLFNLSSITTPCGACVHLMVLSGLLPLQCQETIPSVKLNRSHPADEGVLQGEALSSTGFQNDRLD